jgi:DNA primase
LSGALRLSDEFRSSLTQAAITFHDRITPDTVDYLASRGLDHGAVSQYQLGTADESVPGYADYAGMLCIPYLSPRGGVCALKFRRPHDCTEDCLHSKYISPHETRLYNTIALDRADELSYAGIAEGEVDAITLTYRCGIPSVGVPGVETWTRHPEWASLFRGYRRVLMFADDDEPGRDFAKRVAREIDTAEIVRLPGKDANASYLEYGREEIRMAAGV